MFIDASNGRKVNANHIDYIYPEMNFVIKPPKAYSRTFQIMLREQSMRFPTEQAIINDYGPGILQDISYSICLHLANSEFDITYGEYDTQEEMFKELDDLVKLLN